MHVLLTHQLKICRLFFSDKCNDCQIVSLRAGAPKYRRTFTAEYFFVDENHRTPITVIPMGILICEANAIDHVTGDMDEKSFTPVFWMPCICIWKRTA